MFIQDDEVLDVVVYYKKLGRIYIACSEKDFNEKIKDEKEIGKYKKLTVSMKLLTWGLYNELQDLATLYDEAREINVFSRKKYKEEKLKKLIVRWDATTKNKDGKEIPATINSNVIASISPNIAEAILTSYDEQSVFSEEELGK